MNSNFPQPIRIASLAGLKHRAPRVAVIGAGASGALMALQLLHQSSTVEVVLVEKSGQPGRGLAYSTFCADHVVNVVPDRLSAFPDDPLHFARWLQVSGHWPSEGSSSFVQRRLVGDYLAQLLVEAGPTLAILCDEVTAIAHTGDGVEIALRSGTTCVAEAAVLATGHDWIHPNAAPSDVPPNTTVTILGTGLSMVDRWLSLRSNGHTGLIKATSRRGLLPHVHAQSPRLTLEAASVPVGRPVSTLLRWLRNLAAAQPDWRSAVDAVRPFTRAIWQAWSQDEQRRFLRHARPYWVIHRHRIAPVIHRRLLDELGAGTLRVDRTRAPVHTSHVYDCRGLKPAWDELDGSLIGCLLRQGAVRPDVLGLGLDVTDNAEIIGGDGTIVPTLYAIGPLTRGRFWEIEAIPDIRTQCAALAADLCRRS